MKSTAYTIIFLCLTLVWSCSSDDDSGNNNQNQQPTIEELLVTHAVWTFSDFNIINIIDAGSSTATAQQIEEGIQMDLAGTSILFNSDNTGTLTNPQAQSPFTWQLNADNSLSLAPTSGDPIIFDELNVSENQLRLNTEISFYDTTADYDVEVYGTFVFE